MSRDSLIPPYGFYYSLKQNSLSYYLLQVKILSKILFSVLCCFSLPQHFFSSQKKKSLKANNSHSLKHLNIPYLYLVFLGKWLFDLFTFYCNKKDFVIFIVIVFNHDFVQVPFSHLDPPLPSRHPSPLQTRPSLDPLPSPDQTLFRPPPFFHSQIIGIFL